MDQKLVLTIDDARRIVSAARAEAEKNQWTVTIAVVDDGGFPLALERLDGALPQSAEIAVSKARTAAVMRLPTKTLEDMVKDRPGLVTMPGVTRVQGGLPIKIGTACVGAVGVSGATSAQDEQVAAAGIASIPAPGAA
jgi:glc operon protein GlcG